MAKQKNTKPAPHTEETAGEASQAEHKHGQPPPYNVRKVGDSAAMLSHEDVEKGKAEGWLK